jgi:hypothetical protein
VLGTFETLEDGSFVALACLVGHDHPSRVGIDFDPLDTRQLGQRPFDGVFQSGQFAIVNGAQLELCPGWSKPSLALTAPKQPE